MTHAVTSPLDTTPSPDLADLDGLVALAAAVCGDGTKAVVNLLTTDLQVQLGAHGFEGSASPRRDSMCALVAHEPAPVVVHDARLDPRFADNPWVTGGHVRFYASHQLRTAAGATLGALCVFDDAPRRIDADQRARLASLARTLSVVLEERLRIEALDAEVVQLRRERDELLRSNADLTTFGGYLAHDLLNPVTGLQLALEEVRLERGAAQPDELAVDELLARATRSSSRVQAMIGACPPTPASVPSSTSSPSTSTGSSTRPSRTCRRRAAPTCAAARSPPSAATGSTCAACCRTWPTA